MSDLVVRRMTTGLQRVKMIAMLVPAAQLGSSVRLNIQCCAVCVFIKLGSVSSVCRQEGTKELGR